MKVVSKQDIEKMDDELRVEKKKHEKDLNKIVNPPKMKPIKKSHPPPRISMERFANLPRPPPARQYSEYKRSLRHVAAETVAKLAPEESDAVKDKLLASHDIANLCAEKLFDMNFIENDWLVLGLTIAGKILEAKTGL